MLAPGKEQDMSIRDLLSFGAHPGAPGLAAQPAMFYRPPAGVELPAELADLVLELERLYQTQAHLLADRQRLIDERPAMDEKYRLALGHALASGADDPPRLLEQHDEQLERAAERLSAFEAVVNEHIAELHALIERRRGSWLKAAAKRIAENQASYQEALAGADRARARLVTSVHWARWVESSPETAPGWSDQLLATANRREQAAAFVRVLEKLREDAEQLPKIAPRPIVLPSVLAALRGRNPGDGGAAARREAQWGEFSDGPSGRRGA
jgi:hypothetical protein